MDVPNHDQETSAVTDKSYHSPETQLDANPIHTSLYIANDHVNVEKYILAQKHASPWEDPSNKANPRNWPFWNKVFHTAMPAILSFAV
jgi:hypothetical protein